MGKPRLGKRPPRYKFLLNPHRHARFTSCPKCDARTREKKLPLVIHVDDWGPLVLNKTGRFCPGCQLLIVHQDELDALLAKLLEKHAPEMVDKEYLVLGTLDSADWKRGSKGRLTLGYMLEVLHDFEDHLTVKPLPRWTPRD